MFPIELQTIEYAHVVANQTIQFEILNSNDRALEVLLTGRNPGTVNMSFDGTALQLVPGSQVAAGTGSSRREVRRYLYPGEPPVGPGTLSVSSAVDNASLRIIQRAAVDQTTPLRAQGANSAVSAASASATSSTLNVGASVGDLVHDLIASKNTPTRGAGQLPVGTNMSELVADATTESPTWTFAAGSVAHSAVAWVGSGASQPFPIPYAGTRGKRTWTLQSNLAGEVVNNGATVYMATVTSVESGAMTNPQTQPRADDTYYRRAGTVSLPAIRISANATTSPSTVTLMVNGVASSVTITIPAGTTGWFTGSGTVTIDDNDGLIWRIVNGGGGALTMTMASHVFEADSSETVSILRAYSSSNTQYPHNTTGYLRPAGSRGWDASESNGGLRMPFAATLEGLEAKRTGNYFTASTLDIRTRINGADGNQWVQILPNDQTLEHNDLVNTDTIADGDTLSLGLVSSNGPGETDTEEIEAFTVNAVTTNGDHLHTLGAQSGSSVSIPSGTSYFPLAGEMKSHATQAAAEAVTPIPLAISRLWADLRTNTGTARTDLVLLVDGVETDLRLSMRPGVSGDRRDDLHHVIEVPAGSSVVLKAVNYAATNAVRARSMGVKAVEME